MFDEGEKLTRWCVVTVTGLRSARRSAISVRPVHHNARYFCRRRGWLGGHSRFDAVASFRGARRLALNICPVHDITRRLVLHIAWLHHIRISHSNAKAACCTSISSQVGKGIKAQGSTTKRETELHEPLPTSSNIVTSPIRLNSASAKASLGEGQICATPRIPFGKRYESVLH